MNDKVNFQQVYIKERQQSTFNNPSSFNVFLSGGTLRGGSRGVFATRRHGADGRSGANTGSRADVGLRGKRKSRNKSSKSCFFLELIS